MVERVAFSVLRRNYTYTANLPHSARSLALQAPGEGKVILLRSLLVTTANGFPVVTYGFDFNNPTTYVDAVSIEATPHSIYGFLPNTAIVPGTVQLTFPIPGLSTTAIFQDDGVGGLVQVDDQTQLTLDDPSLTFINYLTGETSIAWTDDADASSVSATYGSAPRQFEVGSSRRERGVAKLPSNGLLVSPDGSGNWPLYVTISDNRNNSRLFCTFNVIDV